MANDIGTQTGIGGTSMGLNNRPGNGGEKPSAEGNASPGGTKPPRVPDSKVPMPK
jgi:hypothetical protein